VIEQYYEFFNPRAAKSRRTPMKGSVSRHFHLWFFEASGMFGQKPFRRFATNTASTGK
jgi:hypothetical protein